MILRHKLTCLLILPALLLSGCFTGIESTPKITSKDLRREQIRTTDEHLLLADVSPQPLAKWQPGKQFYVTDSKIEMALDPTSGAIPVAGSIITFQQIRNVPSVSGDTDTELIFTTETGQNLVYRINSPYSQLSQRHRLDIPFTIEMSVVDSVRQRLLNKQLYVRTNTWYNDTGTNTIAGMKFIPATIIEVSPGNLVYPVRINFKPDSIAHVAEASVYISIDDPKATRSFASMFSIDNPRRNYPLISDEVWDNIIRSRVIKNMTRDEARLAIGSPSSVRRRNAITSLQEIWYYDNGIYLMFEDGILISFRQ